VEGDAGDMLGYLPMGLSLFLTFVLCNFTESEQRGRLDGFPARLFVLPVSTATLVASPLIFSILAVSAIYVLWAKLALPALGRTLPLSWPMLYLGTGMVCYQALVWTLARFRLARLLSLGLGGTLFATGWLVWREEAERELFYDLAQTGLPVRTVLCVLLVVLSSGAFVLASLAVENQRRGGSTDGLWHLAPAVESALAVSALWRRVLPGCLARVSSAGQRPRRRFDSPERTQFWYEWRRHGCLLPRATGAVLLVIVTPTFFTRPIGAEPAGLILCWIVALPLLLAWVLGKGFGKADLWSKAPGPSLFAATRPLGIAAWLGAKLKAAALAAAVAWAIVLVITPLWLRWCCDWPALSREGQALLRGEPWLLGACWCVLPLLVFLTWRFLAGSLWIGLSGKTWLLNLAACGVFLCIFSPVLGASPFVQEALRGLRSLPGWVPYALAALFVAKLIAALVLATLAYRRGLLAWRSLRGYAVWWLGLTTILLMLTCRLVPFELLPRDSGWSRATFVLLTLFLVPLLRVAYAPIAASGNRHG
jgi:hypothetical protein